MRFWGLIAAAMVLLASAPAMAFVTGLEDTIRIGEIPYELSFEVKNSTDTRQPLRIEYDFPTDFETIRQPGFVPANSSETVTVKIYPDAAHQGTRYRAVIKVALGGSTAEKITELTYTNENNCTIERSARIVENTLALELKNNSFKDKEVKLNDVRGLPKGFTLEGPKTFVLSGFAEEAFGLEIGGSGVFIGTLELEFLCARQTFALGAESEEFTEGQGFSGLVLLNALGEIEGEIILDIFLAAVAAILLIAFIARLVRILNERERQTKIEVKKQE